MGRVYSLLIKILSSADIDQIFLVNDEWSIVNFKIFTIDHSRFISECFNKKYFLFCMMMNNSPVKVGLAGFGIAAQVMHAPFITTMKEYKLVSVLERHTDFAQEKYPFVKTVRSFEELIADPEIDLIIITTPNETHFEYAQKGLLAGKHVVLEKPFTNTSEEAKILIDVSKKANRILSVFQNRRYVCDFLTIKKILQENLLGEIVEFEAHYDRYRTAAKPNAWREENKPGSGIFYDLGAHLIDQALVLFGFPKTITADLRMQRPHSIAAHVNDYFDVRLDYGFTKIILSSGMLVREPGPKYMIHGFNGSFIKYGEEPQEALLKEGVLPTIPHWGEEPEDQWGLLHTEINGKIIKEKYASLPGSFGMYYQNLFETIVNSAELREKPEHGFNTIRLIELAIESNEKKCTVECNGFINAKYF
jgi:scyllo-inositol 2-dehydrogenase (NADP+)